MILTPEVLLVGAVIGVGILHTVVPDHWLPITLLARQRGWSRAQTARVAAQAGTGHVVSTLALGLVVWLAGVAVAARFGHAVSLISALALIAFGGWIAIGAIRELREGHGHVHVDANPSQRTALLLILGSSPMVEGIPAFFAASRYGIGLIATMAACFAASTIATYVALCVSSAAGLQRLALGKFERYGEVLSGLVIAIVGAVFLFVPVF
ncbi:MAG TPA: hypothetical protein VGN14_07470 [Candidatus Elarobacter sp.]